MPEVRFFVPFSSFLVAQGVLLRYARMDAGFLDAKQVSEELNKNGYPLHWQKIYRLERGEQVTPEDRETIRQLAKVYRKTVEDLTPIEYRGLLIEMQRYH